MKLVEAVGVSMGGTVEGPLRRRRRNRGRGGRQPQRRKPQKRRTSGSQDQDEAPEEDQGGMEPEDGGGEADGGEQQEQPSGPWNQPMTLATGNVQLRTRGNVQAAVVPIRPGLYVVGEVPAEYFRQNPGTAGVFSLTEKLIDMTAKGVNEAVEANKKKKAAQAAKAEAPSTGCEGRRCRCRWED